MTAGEKFLTSITCSRLNMVIEGVEKKLLLFHPPQGGGVKIVCQPVSFYPSPSKRQEFLSI
jgi:hypothetical protein